MIEYLEFRIQMAKYYELGSDCLMFGVKSLIVAAR